MNGTSRAAHTFLKAGIGSGCTIRASTAPSLMTSSSSWPIPLAHGARVQLHGASSSGVSAKHWMSWSKPVRWSELGMMAGFSCLQSQRAMSSGSYMGTLW